MTCRSRSPEVTCWCRHQRRVALGARTDDPRESRVRVARGRRSKESIVMQRESDDLQRNRLFEFSHDYSLVSDHAFDQQN